MKLTLSAIHAGRDNTAHRSYCVICRNLASSLCTVLLMISDYLPSSFGCRFSRHRFSAKPLLIYLSGYLMVSDSSLRFPSRLYESHFNQSSGCDIWSRGFSLGSGVPAGRWLWALNG